MLRYALVLALLFPLAACAEETDTLPSSASASGSASSGPLSPPTNTMPLPSMDVECTKPMHLISQSKDVLNTMKFGFTVRILGPDSAATMDFSPSRTNIFYDKQGVITEIRCG